MITKKAYVSQECSQAEGCSQPPRAESFLMRPSHVRPAFVTCFHLNNGVAELQRVEKLDEGRHLEPVLLVEAVPLLVGNLQLGGQRGVQAAQPCGQHLRREGELTLNKMAHHSIEGQ